jgi:uncharacterized protein YchJ
MDDVPPPPPIMTWSHNITSKRDLDRFVPAEAKALLYASRMLKAKKDEYLLLTLAPGRAPSLFDLDSAAMYAEMMQYDVVLTTGPLPQALKRVVWTVRTRSTCPVFKAHFGAQEMHNKARCIIVQLGTNGRWIGSKGFMARKGSGNPPRPKKTKKTKPNAKCPCGSGKKYKKCCGGV